MIPRSFSESQTRRGLVLLVAFVVMRALLAGAFGTLPTSDQPLRFALLLAASILVGSVGLVYLGFTRWVGVDLVGWWIDREHLRGDVL